MSDAIDPASSTVGVVGASLAGLRACEAFREEGFSGRLVLVGAEGHFPYDRPPLSKEILLGKWEPDKIVLRRGGLDDLNLEFRRATRAAALDPKARIVTLEDGEKLSYDGPKHLFTWVSTSPTSTSPSSLKCSRTRSTS